jgi:hypothetical protein
MLKNTIQWLRNAYITEVKTLTPYDFKQGIIVLTVVAKKYLSSCLFGIPIEVGNGQKKQIEMMNSVTALLTHKKFDAVEVSALDDELPWAVAWLNSVFQFFRLGLEKQKEGLNPKVYISW